jgi:hypothetical protein
MLTTAAIRHIFEAPLPEDIPLLPIDVEVELVAAAKTRSAEAFERLLDNYRPGIRGLAARESKRMGGTVDIDELRANVLAAFVEAVHSTRPGERVAVQLDPSARQVASRHILVGGLSVPSRSRERYFQALREAQRNGTDPVDEAAALGLARESFFSVKAAIGFDSIDRIIEEWRAPSSASGWSPSGGGNNDTEPGMSAIYVEPGYANAETRHMVRAALAALNDDPVASVIVRDAYGFNDYEAIPDAEVAHRHGLTRPTVQRKRMAALVTMHGAVCADHAPEPRCAREHVTSA